MVIIKNKEIKKMNDLIEKKVITTESIYLCFNYWNLIGTIINYREEKEIKRNSQNGEPEETGNIIEYWQIKFDKELEKEMCKKLWITKYCFKIL